MSKRKPFVVRGVTKSRREAAFTRKHTPKPKCPFCGKEWAGRLPCGHCGEPDVPDPDERY